MHAQRNGMGAEHDLLRGRLAALPLAWPEEDSLRKAWVRSLMQGDWGDPAHVDLTTRFLEDHGAPAVPSDPRPPGAPTAAVPAARSDRMQAAWPACFADAT